MNELTKEQKYTIAKFYKLYIERSNNGETETVANFFGDAKDARENYFCDRDYQDFLTNCQILIQNKYLTGEVLDDNIYNISILNKTFIGFEQNFG